MHGQHEGRAIRGTVEVGSNEYEVEWCVGERSADVLGLVQWNGRRHVTVPCAIETLPIDDDKAAALVAQLENALASEEDPMQREIDARVAQYEREACHD